MKAHLALVALLLFLVAAPATAWAADYRCDQADLVAQVETDGSVLVTDQRIFDFSADGAKSETLTWLYGGFPEDAEVTIAHVRMAALDGDDNVTGEWVVLEPTTFLLSWRQGGRPDSDGWSYDKFQSKLYAFVRDLPDRAVFEVSYQVTHAVEAYDDAADFQWFYAPRDYAVAMHQVKATVVLPMPADAVVEPGDNVRAWGHGPADGTVDIGLDGSVKFFDPVVAPTAYADARVMFPVQWLTNLSDEDKLEHQGSLQYYWTTRYEESWVDRDAHQKMLRDGLSIGVLALSFLVLAGALAVYARWGRERPPAFTDDYYCEVPGADLAPAMLGRLWRWNHESPDDVVATVLDMIRRGALRLRLGDDGRPMALEIPQQGSISDEALDGATLALLHELSEDAESVSLTELSAAAHERPADFLRAVQQWQGRLSALVAPCHFFDEASRRAQHVLLAAAAVLALAAVGSFIFLGWVVGLLVLLAALCVGVLGNYTMRRTPAANDIAAHAKALRNWMRDGGWQAQRDQLTDGERAQLVAYAYLFGVLSCVDDAPDTKAAQLAALAPQLSRNFDAALRAAHHRAEVS
ncbi:DUF2207 domain-containing protein [Adlercreutzia sp. R21]|uniref:DUF2207 family protein n=1 Tax=Adlercreutzia wanghongyangiae TaxID=3111451 RepID=UPI002DBD47D0|nr:DUF2207 domain-containing protein [Adlercreutzia sp. R21]MEC4185336.1 DUF2207 domain-containing protein [Adlercreutzia sp. R21]